ncbi:MAG: hypothetical protein H6721_26510 [Sandaracinus sp.]|nr:hypothetical protein [Sandaracinus sp.]MCB9616058.1 hypothetical protein [Sandaracinus sp.]MCB9620464.1 hypothetical protein [Sandaracinus sp.]MCB9624680.1 hypothetical protein [Sandaracinus sp.]MCB9635686.1 hypothetical protein [Sandaracinus sp.]
MNRAELSVRIAEILRDANDTSLKLGPDDIAKQLRGLAFILDGGGPEARSNGQTCLPGIEVEDREARAAAVEAARRERMRLDMRAVFDYWRAVAGHPTAKLTDERERMMLARLKDGFTVAQMKRAIDGAQASEFHAGKYDWPENIFVSGSRVEQMIARAGDTAPEAVTLDDKRIETLKRRAREALKDGRHDEYEAINRELQRLASR